MEKFESEHGRFIREWLARHPEEIEEQKRGRALWWDKKPQTLEAMKQDIADAVPQKAYYYDVN